MKKSLNVFIIYGISAALFASYSFSATFDMRQCPMNQLIYLDDWTNARFEVEVLREDKVYLCDEGKTKNPVDKTMCKGPYGITVLQGKFSGPYEAGEAKSAAFVYQVIAGVPCCGWSAYLSSDQRYQTAVESTSVIEQEKMINLGDFSTPTISFDEYSDKSDDIFINTMVPMVCR